MSNIGPQIPAHLLRRSADDEDEEAGPSSPPPPGPSIGPQIPAAVEDDDDDDEAWAPSLPPDLAPAPPRVMGPSFPTQQDVQDDSDDEVGPMPLPAGVEIDERGEGVREFIEREERRRKELEDSLKPKALKRDDWMLVPPKASDLLGSLDPTKLKARQFSRSTNERPQEASTLWTETPAERMARLADEVSGKRKRAEVAAGGRAPEEETDDDRKRRKRDMDIKRQIEEHNKSTRSASLLDLHKTDDSTSTSSSARELAATPKGIWDRDRDMSLGGRLMDDNARSRLIKDAKGLGDRFGAGKGGRFM